LKLLAWLFGDKYTQRAEEYWNSKLICERCGRQANLLYPMWFRDDETGEEKYDMTCWDCNFGFFKKVSETLQTMREILEMGIVEEDYEYDPINNPSRGGFEPDEWYEDDDFPTEDIP
jgi:hypothetical protein